MAYTGDVTVGGAPDTRELPGLTVTKVAVGPMDSDAYCCCGQTGTMVRDRRRQRGGYGCWSSSVTRR